MRRVEASRTTRSRAELSSLPWTRERSEAYTQPTNARQGIARRAPASRPARASSFPVKRNVWEAVSRVTILCAQNDKPCMFQSRRFHVWAGGIMAPLLPAHDGLAAVTPQNLCRTGTFNRTSTRRRRASCDDSGSLVVHVPESTVPGLGRGSDGATAARPYWAGSSDATEPLPDGNFQAKTKP